MAYPIPKGYGTVVGSHVWQGCGVHAEGTHTWKRPAPGPAAPTDQLNFFNLF